MRNNKATGLNTSPQFAARRNWVANLSHMKKNFFNVIFVSDKQPPVAYVVENASTVEFFEFVRRYKYSSKQAQLALDTFYNGLDIAFRKCDDPTVKRAVEKKRKDTKV